MLLTDRIKGAIRDVKDYPSQGIVFKDITPVLLNPPLMKDITAHLVDALTPLKLDAIAAVEARGFIFGSILEKPPIWPPDRLDSGVRGSDGC